jgi:hypothetical protein
MKEKFEDLETLINFSYFKITCSLVTNGTFYYCTSENGTAARGRRGRRSSHRGPLMSSSQPATVQNQDRASVKRLATLHRSSLTRGGPLLARRAAIPTPPLTTLTSTKPIEHAERSKAHPRRVGEKKEQPFRPAASSRFERGIEGREGEIDSRDGRGDVERGGEDGLLPADAAVVRAGGGRRGGRHHAQRPAAPGERRGAAPPHAEGQHPGRGVRATPGRRIHRALLPRQRR